jgi:hypothetical protein
MSVPASFGLVSPAREGCWSTSSVAKKGGRSGPYADWTVADLRKRAKQLGLNGCSAKPKRELIEFIRDH